jgi:hypothetical protein
VPFSDGTVRLRSPRTPSASRRSLFCLSFRAEISLFSRSDKILFGYAPEVFPTPVRGTGDALAATANRVFGPLVPIIKMYGSGSNGVPVFVTAGLLVFAGALALGLPVETAGVDAL